MYMPGLVLFWPDIARYGPRLDGVNGDVIKSKLYKIEAKTVRQNEHASCDPQTVQIEKYPCVDVCYLRVYHALRRVTPHKQGRRSPLHVQRHLKPTKSHIWKFLMFVHLGLIISNQEFSASFKAALHNPVDKTLPRPSLGSPQHISHPPQGGLGT